MLKPTLCVLLAASVAFAGIAAAPGTDPVAACLAPMKDLDCATFVCHPGEVLSVAGAGQTSGGMGFAVQASCGGVTATCSVGAGDVGLCTSSSTPATAAGAGTCTGSGAWRAVACGSA